MPKGIAFGRYELLQRLAVGGMAELFIARVGGEGGFRKTCVVKRVLPHLSGDPAFVKMFLREGRVVSSLNHPNIVQVFDFGRVEQDYFLAMEYLAGEDLADVLRQCREAGRELPVWFALQVVRDICAALDHAHQLRGEEGKPLGLVHRDISPSNVLVTYHGTVKVLDFGIAREAGSERHTASGEVRGKPAYMAPEQLLNEPIGETADVWAAGVCLYELLTSRRPFQGRSAAEISVSVCRDELTPPSALRAGLPPSIDHILGRALARDPKRRCSARELQQALHACLAELQVPEDPNAVAALLRELFGEAKAEEKLLGLARGGSGPVPATATSAPEKQTTLERPPRSRRRGVVALMAGGASILALTLGARAALMPSGTTVAAEVAARPAANAEVGSELLAPEKLPADASVSGEAATPEPPKEQQEPLSAGKDVRPPPPVPVADVAEAPAKARGVAAKIAHGYLTVRGSTEADVFLGTRRLGRLPLERFALPPGKKVLRISNPALGVQKEIAVTVSASKEARVQVSIAKGRLNINAEPWAEVWLNGVLLGQTPLSREVFEGVHRVRLVGPKQERSLAVTVRGGITAVVQEDLR